MLIDNQKADADDHSYSLPYLDTPRKLKRKLVSAVERENSLRKKLKVKDQKCRLKKKVTFLLEVVSRLEDEKLITSNAAEVLKSSFSGIPLELMERMLTNSKRGTITRATYPPALRPFALTLSFYSSKAYNFVRKCLILRFRTHLRCVIGIRQ